MGPTTGGAVSLADLTSIAFRRDHTGSAAWILSEPGQLLVVPVDAAGAEALFDAFTTLPGLGAQRLLAARQGSRGSSCPTPVGGRSGQAAPAPAQA